MPSWKSSSLRLVPLPPALFSLTLLLASSGCLSVSKENAADAANLATPEAWQNQTVAKTPSDPNTYREWWHQFNDPVLEQLITDALSSSPDIRTALSRITEARARLGVQRAALAPSVTASVSGQGSRREIRATDVVTKSEAYSASLDASWEIDLFGSVRATTHATAEDLAGTVENYHAAQVSLAAEVATAYVTLRSAEAQFEVVEQSLASRRETLQLLQWQEQSGYSDALATQQAVSTYEQARASLPALQQTIAQTRNALALLSGKTPGALDSLLATTAKVPASAAAIAIGIPAETLRQRPDIRAAGHAFQAAAYRLTAAERNRLPSLTLSGSIGVDALHAGKLFDPTSTVASVAGGLSAPLFNFGRLKQTVQIQDALQQQALLGYETAVLTALSEVENALIAVQRSGERLAILERAVAAAREASTLANLQYEAGSVDILTVLETQRTLLSTEQQQVTTTADQTTAYIQLYKALGGGWTSLTASTTASL